MTSNLLFNVIVVTWLILSAAIFISLFFIVAPYGRHMRGGWGLSLDSKIGWIVMESSSPLIFAVCFALGTAPVTVTTVIFLLLWEAHYIHRAFIYPFSLKSSNEKMPISIALSGLCFNIVNASLNGYYIFTLSGGYPNQWMADPRFIIGTTVFIGGFVINKQADDTLAKLRNGGETGYKIPQGGLYRWISCPNYFGEILTWAGWAVATWSLAGLSFAAWSVANLAPRAVSHHKWYHGHFPAYPAGRKALVPGIW